MTAEHRNHRSFRPVWTRLVGVGTVAATVGALALTACSPAGSGDSGGKKGTFVVARTGDIDQLDPHKTTAFQSVETLGLVYSTLVQTDDKGKVVPGLATTWDTSPDGKTLTLTLRSGVKFQDGTAFGSADVKASLEAILNQANGAVGRSNLVAVAGIDTPSATSVVLHLKTPSAALLYALSSVNTSIESAKDIAAGTVGKKPNGTGPFAWKDWQQGQQVELTGNASYYGGAPKIKLLQFRVIPSESSILSGMRAGAFQLGLLSDPGVAKQVGAKPSGFTMDKVASLSYHTLMLNGRSGPLQNQSVRQAIACAVDRDQVLKTAAYGDGTVTGPITSPSYQLSATDGLPCTPGDLTKAKALLAAGGYPNGFHLRTIVETGEYATSVAEGQNLQAQLQKIGVVLDLQQLTTSPYVQAWLGAKFDAAVALNGGSSDPHLAYGRYFVTGGSLATPAGLASPALSGLLTKGDTTLDESARRATYGDLQKQMLAESPWVWLYRSDDYYLVGSSVRGFTPRADQSLLPLAGTS